MRAPLLYLLRTWLWKHRALLLVTAAALAIRLVWNLRVHPPTGYAYSDMGGYLERGNLMVDKPGLRDAGLALYPYGTHAFIGALRWVFGRRNDVAINAGFAVLGTLAVAYSYATARRFLIRPWARHLAALVLVGYYPWIALGGYTLSEIPFALCVAASAFHGLRLADLGRRSDAWLLGLFLGVGATVRPQILVAVAFLGLLFLVRRGVFRRFRRGLLVRAAIPLAIVLGASAYRLHRLDGHWGLISTNGPLNFVFGRCHNTALDAVTPTWRGFFGPPSLGSLLYYELEEVGKHRGRPLFTLDPVFGERLQIRGKMWDAEPNYRLAQACVTTSGALTQIRFAVTHVVLLWGYNIIWPDQGHRRWHRPMEIACALHNIAFLVPSALGLLLAFRRRRARSMLLALHFWAVVVTSMLYFGDTRYRAPYDGLLVVLALSVYVEVGGGLRAIGERLRWRRAQRRARAAAIPSSPAGSGSGASAAAAAASAASLIR